jgi:hypothetical protein
MVPAHTDLPPSSASARVAALADAVEARAAAHAALLDRFRAYLDDAAPGRSRSGPEHLLELVDLGLRWRAQVPPARRARAAEAGGEQLARLTANLAEAGCPAAAFSRLCAWRDFSLSQDVTEVVSVADGLCSWFEKAAGLLGPDLSAPGEALELVRAEVLGRTLRRRPQVLAPATRAGLRR